MLGKRSGDDNWRANTAPKRSSGPPSGSKRKFGAGPDLRGQGLHDRPPQAAKQQGSSNSGHYSQSKAQNRPQPWNQPPPLMSKSVPPSQRFNNSKPYPPARFNDYTPRPSRRDFKPTKVTKPKPLPSASVGKLVSYPIPLRKGLVEATKSVKTVADSIERSFILRKNAVPSQQLVGRLELCLGTVIKDVKTQFGTVEKHKHIFQSQNMLRLMKKAIRERIRNVMIGKYVGKVTSIVEEYRKVFPVETDVEILNVAMEHFASNKQLVIRLDDADTPETYFKTNMSKLLNTILDDMFEKVQHIYENISEEEAKNTFTEIMEDFTKDVQADTATDKSVPKQNKNDETEETENGNIKEAIDESIEKEVDENVTNKINENVGIEDDATADTEVDENAVKEDDVTAVTEVDENTPENVDTNDEGDKLNEQETKDDSKPDILETSATDEVSGKETPVDTKTRFKRLESLASSLIKRRLGAMLPKFKSNLLKVLDVNEMYNITKQAIISQLESKLSIVQRVEDAKKGKKTPVVSLNAPTPVKAKELVILPHYVKIQGHPFLPKRKVMQGFLKKFHPKSIKKHRNMPLLFVGFTNKEDFDKLLAVKETTIGNLIITIKVSEKPLTNRGPDSSLNSTAFEDDDIQQLDTETPANSSDVINSDLDDQINDLLSSIRKEEEIPKQDGVVTAVENAKETAEVPVETNEDVAVESDKAIEDITEENNVENGEENDETNGVEADAKVEQTEGDAVENEDADNKMETDVSEPTIKDEANDIVDDLKTETKGTGRATPNRMSARNANAATPSTIRTRRASRLAQN